MPNVNTREGLPELLWWMLMILGRPPDHRRLGAMVILKQLCGL
jgi:hypothetical protein